MLRHGVCVDIERCDMLHCGFSVDIERRYMLRRGIFVELGTRLTGGRGEFSTPAMLCFCFSADLQWSEHLGPFWTFHAAVPLVKAASSRN